MCLNLLFCIHKQPEKYSMALTIDITNEHGLSNSASLVTVEELYFSFICSKSHLTVHY